MARNQAMKFWEKGRQKREIDQDIQDLYAWGISETHYAYICLEGGGEESVNRFAIPRSYSCSVYNEDKRLDASI